jgi:hypothetical protein
MTVHNEDPNHLYCDIYPDPDAARGKIIGSTIMFIGVGTIIILISSLTAGLIR